MEKPLIGIDASRALRARRTGTERYALEIIRHLLWLPDAQTYRWRFYVDDTVAETAWSWLPENHYSDMSSGAGENRLFFNASQAEMEWCHLPRQRLWTHRALRAELSRRPPDLLFVPAHVIPFRWQGFWQWSMEKITEKAAAAQHSNAANSVPKFVVTIHDLGYHAFPEAHTWFQRLYLPLSTRWNAYIADHVITPSTYTALDLERRYATPPQKITVIHEAQSALEPSLSAHPMISGEVIDAVRVQHGLPIFYALYVGTLQPRKNLRRLLLAYAKATQESRIHFHLALAGAPGWQQEDLAGLAAQLNMTDQVHFLGYVSDDTLAALYQGAHFFTFPSLFEGFGLPILEAQSHGVPVMCANNSSLPEIAGDGALLVDPTDVDAIADAMLRLSEDEALRQELIERGYANADRFSWEKAARETLAVFEKVLGRDA